MSPGRLKSISREVLRWYLQKFPLRDGKAYFYRLLQGGLTPAHRYITVTLAQGFNLKLDLGDPDQRKIYFYGDYDERHEGALVRRMLEPREVFWDIGANIGYFSLLAAATLKNTGQVVALEPGRTAFKSLNDNIALNPFQNIRTYDVAAADKEGEALLYSSPDTADGRASLFQPCHGRTGSQICRTVTLDHFQENLGLTPPDFIKIDVEGAELAVLRGAARILRSRPPLLLVEMKEATLKAAGTDKAAIQELLQGYGYLPASLQRRRWHVSKDVKAVKSRNIFWFNPALPTHRHKAARLPVGGGW
ncbi:MAG: FkbM family methyltransferase [Thermodesulfobacteriota bacterium]